MLRIRLSGGWRSRNSSAGSACPAAGGPAVCCWVTVAPELQGPAGAGSAGAGAAAAASAVNSRAVNRGKVLQLQHLPAVRGPRWLLAPADLGGLGRGDALDAV